VDFQEHPSRTELSRSLLAADAGIDPHRLVTLCCEHAGDDPLSVSLVIPVEDKSRPWSESTAAAERLLHKADVLLGAAGVRLEEVVISDGAGQELGDLVRSGGFDALLICAEGEPASSAVLPLAVSLARAHGLAVLESPDPPGHTGWLRRAVGSLTHWPSV
jgi:nucleotide-binding universal stress UspA family protein